jgi:hypothetical protein
MNPPAGRATIHGIVTTVIVSLRIVSAILFVAADVLRRIADVIASGRDAPKTSDPDAAGTMQLVL